MIYTVSIIYIAYILYVSWDRSYIKNKNGKAPPLYAA